MNLITTILISAAIIVTLSAIIVTLSAIIYVLIKDKKSLKKEITQLTNALKATKSNLTQLAEYVDTIQKIKSDKDKTSEQIKEAENDEEVYDIISNLIKSNNDKLRNKTKK